MSAPEYPYLGILTTCVVIIFFCIALLLYNFCNKPRLVATAAALLRLYGYIKDTSTTFWRNYGPGSEFMADKKAAMRRRWMTCYTASRTNAFRLLTAVRDRITSGGAQDLEDGSSLDHSAEAFEALVTHETASPPTPTTCRVLQTLPASKNFLKAYTDETSEASSASSSLSKPFVGAGDQHSRGVGGSGEGKPGEGELGLSLNPPRSPVSKDDLERYITTAIYSPAIDAQFQSVVTSVKKMITVASLPHNLKKNRYKNNLPYDETRVVLEGAEEADYINASYVKGHRDTRAYIATQGPKDFNACTFGDFWGMVWQHNTNIVVMLGNLIENGKVKVHRYWPETPGAERLYKEVAVKLESEEKHCDFILRFMFLTKGTETRQLVHYQFTAWPDHYAPHTPFAFALLVEDICKWHKTGPPVVHCSAGFGRTGTLLLVLRLLENLEFEAEFNPPATLLSLRQCRPRLVENTVQYMFVHQVLLEVLFSGKTSRPASEFPSYLASSRHLLPAQYHKLKALPIHVTTRWAAQPEHAHFNRNQDVLPVDGRQIFLQVLDGAPQSQYVNAVRVNGITQRDAAVVTEHPMPHVVGRVWRMVFEFRAPLVLFLQQHEDEQSFPSLLPPDGSGVLDNFSITVMGKEHHQDFSVTNVTIFPVSMKMAVPVHNMEIIELMNWASSQELPDSTLPLLRILERLQKIRQSNPTRPIIISCSDGYSASGVAVALDLVLSKVKLMDSVDVYRAVQGILFDRPQFIKSERQYDFIHDSVNDYLREKEKKAPRGSPAENVYTELWNVV